MKQFWNFSHSSVSNSRPTMCLSKILCKSIIFTFACKECFKLLTIVPLLYYFFPFFSNIYWFLNAPRHFYPFMAHEDIFLSTRYRFELKTPVGYLTGEGPLIIKKILASKHARLKSFLFLFCRKL